MNRGLAKAEALDDLKRFLLARAPQSFSKSDLAERYNRTRKTIWEWIGELEDAGFPIQHTPDRKVFVDSDSHPTYLRLSREESVLVMLALRTMQQYVDKPLTHVTKVLEKLGLTLSNKKGIAPQVGQYVLKLAQQTQVSTEKSDYQKTFDAVVRAWLNHQKIRIRYRPLHARAAFNDVFHPYLLEPSAIGHCTYMIGYSETAGGLRTRKLERIEGRPEVTDETFAEPDIDIHSLLKGAWGIWFADDQAKPTQVRLRFDRSAAQRLHEATWHPSEQKDTDEHGNIIWNAQLDEWQEITPWVLGWGADCEVLEPAELRQRVIENIQQSSRNYGLDSHHDDGDDRALRAMFGGSDE